MFNCDNCGEIECVLFNGYCVAERLLEDIMFEVRRLPEKIYIANVAKTSEKFFDNFNQEKWLKRIAEFAEGYDIATCPKCRGDVDLEIQ